MITSIDFASNFVSGNTNVPRKKVACRRRAVSSDEKVEFIASKQISQTGFLVVVDSVQFSISPCFTDSRPRFNFHARSRSSSKSNYGMRALRRVTNPYLVEILTSNFLHIVFSHSVRSVSLS